MDADEIFFGPDHLNLKKLKFADENNGKSVKCKDIEVNNLLSLRKNLLEQPYHQKWTSLSEALWDNDLKLAKVTKVSKNLTKNFAHTRDKQIYLYPEECLCLMELKCLLLRWNERILSVHNAYTLLLDNNSGCSFEEFRTYIYLVKQGFRVFRHDKTLVNTNNFNPNDLTKLPIKSKKKKSTNNNQIKNVENVNNTIDIPKVNSDEVRCTKVVLFMPREQYLPHNVLPYWGTYSFILDVNSDSTMIISIMYSEKIINLETNIHSINNSQQNATLTGKYPVYEKNIVTFNKSGDHKIEDFNYEPFVKKSKLCLAVKTNNSYVTRSISKDEKYSKCSDNETNPTNKICVDQTNRKNMNNKETNVSTLSDKEVNKSDNKNYVPTLNKKFKLINRELENLYTGENIITDNSVNSLINKMTDSVLNDKNSLHASFSPNNASNDLHNEINKEYSEQIMKESKLCINSRCSEKKDLTNNFDECSLENTISENVFGTRLNIQSSVMEKLVAIKSKPIHKLTEDDNEYRVHYDVYYPNNNVPKTSKVVPDFRVTVFNDADLGPFPNIHKATVSLPNDHIPMLWAIVNSSQVSFYSVDNIVLPKSTGWDKKKEKD